MRQKHNWNDLSKTDNGGRFVSPEPGRAEGPVQQLVAAAAERSGPETQPDRAAPAVAPGEAEAAILRAIEWNLQAAAGHHLEAALACAEGCGAHARYHKSRELQHRDDACSLGSLLPQPDSEASLSERSGRRNAKCAGTDASEKTL